MTKLVNEIQKGFTDAKRGLSRLWVPAPVGTRIIATRDFGSIQEGHLGIIARRQKVPFLFRHRFQYLCTFSGGVKVVAKPKEIDHYDHGRTLEQIEQPLNPYSP